MMGKSLKTPRPTIFTVGHSTRAFEDFVAVLRSFEIEAVADVRLIPKSRRYPHFADEFLAEQLPQHGIAYLPFKQLGGRRRAVSDGGTRVSAGMRISWRRRRSRARWTS